MVDMPAAGTRKMTSNATNLSFFAEACGWRGKGIMNKKAAMFRDEMVKYHIKQKNIRGDVWKNHKRNIESETTQAEIS